MESLSLTLREYMNELSQKKKEIEELSTENADLAEEINQLEVCVGQLLKEVKYLKHEMMKAHAGNNAAK